MIGLKFFRAPYKTAAIAPSPVNMNNVSMFYTLESNQNEPGQTPSGIRTVESSFVKINLH